MLEIEITGMYELLPLLLYYIIFKIVGLRSRFYQICFIRFLRDSTYVSRQLEVGQKKANIFRVTDLSEIYITHR